METGSFCGQTEEIRNQTFNTFYYSYILLIYGGIFKL